MADTPSQQAQKGRNIFGYVWRGCLALVFLLIFGPFLIEMLYVGRHGVLYRVACQSNMKQLGLALAQYEQDSDGIQPPVNSTGTGWREAIFPYVKSTGLYQCPADPWKDNFTSESLPRSYAANHLGPDNHRNERGAFSGPGEASANLYTAGMDHPSTTIILADTRGDQNEEWNMVSPTFLPQSQANPELYAHIPRHLFFEHVTGTLNLLMADGHVKALKPLATLTPINFWTRDNAPFIGQELSNARAILKHAEDE